MSTLTSEGGRRWNNRRRLMPPPRQQPRCAELATASTNQISTIKLVCRAVDLSASIPDANPTLVSILENELKSSPFFDPKDTQVVSQITSDESTPTRTFTVTLLLVLKTPLTL